MFSTTSRLSCVRSKLIQQVQKQTGSNSGIIRGALHTRVADPFSSSLFFITTPASSASVVVAQNFSQQRFCSSKNDNNNNNDKKENEKKESTTTPTKTERKEDSEKKAETPAEEEQKQEGEVQKDQEKDNNNTDKTTTPKNFYDQMKMAGSSKQDEQIQVEKHKQEEDMRKTPPKGFEMFFLPPYQRPPAEDAKTPTILSNEETRQIQDSDRLINEAKLYKRFFQFTALIMALYIFNRFRNRGQSAHHLGGEALYYYDRNEAARLAAKKAREEQQQERQRQQQQKATAESSSTTNATSSSGAEGEKQSSGENGSSSSSSGETSSNTATAASTTITDEDFPLSAEDFDTDKIKYVMADPENHSAVYYAEDGRRLFTQKFIDFSTWLRDIESRATENGPFVRLDVHIAFPVVAIAFLWLMPVLGRFYRSVNFGLGHARKEAQNALKKAQNISELETPSKGRFRFKKEHELTTRLDDVAGLTEAKHEVTEIIDFLKTPDKYLHLGAKLPKGVLIDGPPGVGKTLLARAVAGEAGLNFVSCSGSEFDEVYVGVGAMRVRELFKAARENAPCVVFIDEIDTFGKKRRRDAKGSSRGTINALLSELDGFKETSRIMVLAATNRADILDDALTRSGRFDRKITVDLPPHKDRVAIAKVHLKNLKLNPALTLEQTAESIASLTPGCSGADMYNICNEAAIVASRLDKDFVDMECFHKAMDRIMIGLERKARKYEKHEKERLAIHEAGHVVLTWFLKSTDPIMKATIAPRGGSTEGISRKLPHEKFIITQDALHERMIARLGGYVAEEFFFTNISANAAEDLAKVTNEARHEICTYGMSPKVVGHFGYPTNEEDVITKPYSGAKANIVDKEISDLVTNVSDIARDMLKKYQHEVRTVAGILLKQETVTAKELWVLLGERPHMSPEFRKYLESETH